MTAPARAAGSGHEHRYTGLVVTLQLSTYYALIALLRVEKRTLDAVAILRACIRESTKERVSRDYL